MNHLKNYKKGFTLVETLVAVSILSLSIVAAFTAVQIGLQSSYVAKDQITAFYLVQEGMEAIRNVRDNNALRTLNGESVSWLEGLAASGSDPCYFGNTCTVDAPLKVLARCPGSFGSCPPLKRDPVSLLLGYTSNWTPTNFTREIQLQRISSNEVNITMSLSWVTRGVTKSFQVTESLFSRE